MNEQRSHARIWGQGDRRSRAIAIGRLAALTLSLVTLAAGFVVMRGGSHQATAAICNDTVPLGALPPAVPEWCKEPLTGGTDAHTQGANSWLDDFDHGQVHATLSSAYVSGDYGLTDSLFWQHNNHWMVDIQGPGRGGAWMRPNRTFSAENGKLVVESEVAPSIATYNSGNLGDFWPEIVLTTAPAPTFARPSALYLYDEFANHWTFGCRLQRDGTVICALFRNDAGGPGSASRLWEASWFQHAGSYSFGGATWAAPGAWKMCSNSDDPDMLCRNKFRLEVTSDSFTLFVNGTRYFEQRGLRGLDNLLAQPLYVYNGNTLYQFGDGVLRTHWDHFAVNPESSGGGTPPPPPPTTAVPTTATSTPTSTPTQPAATATPTRTPTVTATPGNTAPCRIAVQQFVRNKWRTIRYENVDSAYCAR